MSKIYDIPKGIESFDATKILEWSLSTFGEKVSMASSFQCEESVLIDMLYRIKGSGDFRIFTLDTGRLNEETYEVMEAMREKYGLKIESMFPDSSSVEKLEKEKGFYSFRVGVEERKECCKIRKVIPLRRMLDTLDAWITGLRADQSTTRVGTSKIEKDVPREGLIKINPLIEWSNQNIWDYIRDNKVPYNRLHDKGYPSIGCSPCTRPIKPYESIRSGRWWWESPESKECGLHSSKK